MDINSIVNGSMTGAIVGIVYIIYKIVKKCKFRSRCCGGEESSLDVSLIDCSRSNSPMTV